MSYRSANIYISSRNKKRLRLIASVSQTHDESLNIESREASPDEVGDALLTEAILTHYPAIVELEAEIKELEAKYSKQLGALPINGEKKGAT